MWQFYFQFLEKLSHWLPQWLHQSAATLIAEKGFPFFPCLPQLLLFSIGQSLLLRSQHSHNLHFPWLRLLSSFKGGYQPFVFLCTLLQLIFKNWVIYFLGIFLTTLYSVDINPLPDIQAVKISFLILQTVPLLNRQFPLSCRKF